MRFSDNGYYVEKYIKCDCCGLLVYDEGHRHHDPERGELVFCSPWCREWQLQKFAGIDFPVVDRAFTG